MRLSSVVIDCVSVESADLMARSSFSLSDHCGCWSLSISFTRVYINIRCIYKELIVVMVTALRTLGVSSNIVFDNCKYLITASTSSFDGVAVDG
jgi:hypothetical protein